jgi:hypothetical protein
MTACSSRSSSPSSGSVPPGCGTSTGSAVGATPMAIGAEIDGAAPGLLMRCRTRLPKKALSTPMT